MEGDKYDCLLACKEMFFNAKVVMGGVLSLGHCIVLSSLN